MEVLRSAALDMAEYGVTAGFLMAEWFQLIFFWESYRPRHHRELTCRVLREADDAETAASLWLAGCAATLTFSEVCCALGYDPYTVGNKVFHATLDAEACRVTYAQLRGMVEEE